MQCPLSPHSGHWGGYPGGIDRKLSQGHTSRNHAPAGSFSPMIVSTDSLMPYMCGFTGIFMVFFTVYSIKTGKAQISYQEIDKEKQPTAFKVAIYIYILIAILMFVLTILSLLGVKF
jgi:hypothetical protein